MILIGISGKRRTGKTTLAEILAKTYGFTHLSFAKVLKQEVRDKFGLTQCETDGANKESIIPSLGITPREVMIRWGQAVRGIDPNYWVKQVQAEILGATQAQLGRYVISDVRFINEADWIRRHGGNLIRLERDESYTGTNIDDPSETQLDGYFFDYVVASEANCKLQDLETTAKGISQWLQLSDSAKSL